MPPTAPTVEYPTPIIGDADQTQDLARLFPTIMPHVEQTVYQTIRDACSSRTIFPTDGGGLPLPAAFSIPPDVSLFDGKDSTYAIPAGFKDAGDPVPQIPVVRGWPAFPGTVPGIGVAEATTSEDQGERTTQAGFASDVFATDAQGNVIATAAYYAEPLSVTVVIELVHTNRDERDRLHDQLYRVIFPLRRLLASESQQVRDVTIDAEKQDLPVDEQPDVFYVSVFTVQVSAEALIPTEIVPGGVITELDTTVAPYTPGPAEEAPCDVIDLT
jgi:hypothetical protein